MHQLDNKVYDIIDARCNHEVLSTGPFYKATFPAPVCADNQTNGGDVKVQIIVVK